MPTPMSDDFFQRRVGTVLCGKWTLERLLGVGGMAAVYEARHHIGRRDAIKVLHPSAGRSAELRARFEQEARAVARLGHPGAVRVDDVDTAEDGSIFLVMELLDGETLADRVSRGGVAPLDEALRWADELLDVLGAAHAIGIVHRDVKPDNVFLTRDGRVKLLDFGIARMRDGQGDLRTATGVAIGTLPFMPPEQARGLAIDARADVFALGATLVRVVAGRTVHDAGSDAELFLRVASEPAPPAQRLAPHLPADACAVLDRALAFDREQRYPDAASMQADVRALRAGRRPAAALQPMVAAAPAMTHAGAPAGTGAAAVPGPVAAATMPGSIVAPSPTTSPPTSRSRRPIVGWVLGGSVAAGVILAAVVLTLIRSDGEPDLGPAEAGGAALAPADVARGDADPGGAGVVPAGASPTPGARLAATGRGTAPSSPAGPGGTATAPVPPRAPPPPAAPGAQPTSPPSSSPPPPPAPRKPDDDDPKDREKDRKSKEKERGKDREKDRKGKGRGKDDD